MVVSGAMWPGMVGEVESRYVRPCSRFENVAAIIWPLTCGALHGSFLEGFSNGGIAKCETETASDRQLARAAVPTRTVLIP
jgi:hypothetical protein